MIEENDEDDRFLNHNEFEKLLTAAETRRHVHSLRDTAMLAVCGLCGLRAIELTGIRFGDLFRIEERPSIIGVYGAKQRGVSYQEVVVPPAAALALIEYAGSLPETDKAAHMRVFNLTTRQANRVFRYYAKRAGLNPCYSIHALRHFKSVQLYQETKKPGDVKAAIAGSITRSTMIYVHTVDHLEKAGGVDRKISAEEQAFLDS